MDVELQRAYNGIVQTLVRFGGLGEEEARRRLDASTLLEFGDETERELFFHEEPYYWAMSLLYGKDNPEWYRDANLWPPPKSYYDRAWRENWATA